MDFEGRKPPVIFERGYPSKDFIAYLEGRGIRYVMRAPKGFNTRVGRMSGGSRAIELGEGMRIRAIVFQHTNGEREAPATNLEEGEAGEGAFPELYYKRRPAETKYNQARQKRERENSSGRLADNIKQDFYAMMTVSNMPAGVLREANGKIRERGERRGCGTNTGRM